MDLCSLHIHEIPMKDNFKSTFNLSNERQPSKPF